MEAKILIVDDEPDIRFSLKGILEDEGYSVIEADSGEAGLERVEQERPSLIFLDIWLPGMDGMTVLETLTQEQPLLPVVMISGHGNIETAVTAIKKGAFDFIEKPLSLEKVLIAAKKALEVSSLRQENQELRSRVRASRGSITGRSKAAELVQAQIHQVAPTEAWVLITGENGTGKEIVARSIHLFSKRADKPLVAVNCAAIPEELIESELFGHEKGAFTGADQPKVGKFELAHKGTLFLDEIADMSLKTQAKILRILQEQSFERVGGSKTIKVDVRVIAATNKSLIDEIREGRFREDLFYRLNVFPIKVPSLRDRAEDIPIFISDFMAELCAEHNFKPLEFADAAMKTMKAYSWPGNVRELKNFVERMLIMFGGRKVDIKDLPVEFGARRPISENAGSETNLEMIQGLGDDFKEAKACFEKAFLEAKLKEYGGNMTQLSEAIGMERSYLYRKLKSYGVTVRE